MVNPDQMLGYEEGDILVQCTKGFTWNDTSDTGIHLPDSVTVIKEYPRFILVEASFKSNGGKTYRECINKAMLIDGSCYFRKWERGN